MLLSYIPVDFKFDQDIYKSDIYVFELFWTSIKLQVKYTRIFQGLFS